MAPPLVTALQCMTVATAQPAALTAMFIDDLGWERVATGLVGAALARLWGLSESPAGEATILRSPGSSRGMVRVVTGVEQIGRAHV